MMKEQTSSAATQRESLSALADGELQGAAFAQAMSYAGTREGQDQWQMYHMIGEVLRSREPVLMAQPSLLPRLRQQLAKEPQPPVFSPDTPGILVPVAAITDTDGEPLPAANASVLRWKAVAGCASLAAAAALGWNVHVGVLTAQAEPEPATASTMLATSNTQHRQETQQAHSSETQVMLRDPRLDELLAAHRQFGNTTALQMPAGFLRNATFEAPKR